MTVGDNRMEWTLCFSVCFFAGENNLGMIEYCIRLGLLEYFVHKGFVTKIPSHVLKE